MPKTPRVLHLRASNFFGGPERQILRYTTVEGVDSAVASYTGDGCGTEFLSRASGMGLPVFELPAGKKAVLSAVRSLAALLREQEVDLLCTHDYRSDIIGVIAARRANVRCVPFLRGWTGENATVKSFESIDRAILPFASRVVCLSETHSRQMARKLALAGKIRVVTNAIEVAPISSSEREAARRELCSRFSLRPQDPIVVSAGRLSPEKGVSVFLDAMPEVLKQHPNAQFVIFGHGAEEESLRARATSRQIGKALVFAGHVADFNQLLPGADLLVNPSFAEQMPNVVLEAMSVEVPVVATRAGAVEEIAGNPPSIALVDRGDDRAISEQVIQLLNDPVRGTALRDAALGRLRSAYSPQVQRAQLMSLYRELIPQLASAPQLHNDRLPLVSVVIPVRNEERHLGAVLDRLLEQNYPGDRVEIIVADGNSTDGTADLVKRYAASGVRYALNPAQLSSAGRNVGVQKSRGQIVVFIDGHCEIPSRNLLRDTVELLESTGADALARPQPLTVTDSSNMQKAIATARSSLLGHGTDSTIFDTVYEGSVDPTSSGATYRREVFDRIGFYNEAFDACEDVEFNHRVKRAGLKCWISPKLTICYHPRESLGGLFRQMMRYGIGRAKLAKTHADAFTFAQLVPALFVVGVPLGALLSVVFSSLWPVYLAVLGCYFAALLISSGSAMRMRSVRFRTALLIPPALIVIHTGLGFGFLKGLFRGSKQSNATAAKTKPNQDTKSTNPQVVAR